MELFNGLHAWLWRSVTANNCNTYLIDGPVRILIDPGHARLFHHVENGLNNLGLSIGDVHLVICTHAHPDHIEAVRFFRETAARFTLHAADWAMLEKMEKYMSVAGGPDAGSQPPRFFLREGGLEVSGVRIEVLHTPGHSPGSISLYWPDHDALFTGDLVFKSGVGRTDLPGGDPRALKESISRLAARDAAWLLPGHGDVISGKEAVRENFSRIQQTWLRGL